MMDEKLLLKIQNDFDRIALLEQANWNHNNHYHDFLLKQLPADCNTVLEIGCGTGQFTRLLAERSAQVVAIDLAPKMIEIAKRQSESYKNIDFQVADILKWQSPLQQFDAIVSIATVHHLPIEALLPKLRDALRTGGKLVILDLVKSEGISDILLDAIAVPLNWIWLGLKNRRLRPTPDAVQAWREHGRTDEYLTRSQAQQIYTKTLIGAIVRRHLFWRYSLVWEKTLEF